MEKETDNFDSREGIALEEGEDSGPETAEAVPEESPEHHEENEMMDAEADVIEANHETMEKVLEMFGTDAARDRFLDLVKHYYRAARFQSFAGITNVITQEQRERATYHNAIMETLQRLSMSPKMTPEQQNILLFLSDREKTEKMIIDYYSLRPNEVGISKLGMMRKGMFEDKLPPFAGA